MFVDRRFLVCRVRDLPRKCFVLVLAVLRRLRAVWQLLTPEGSLSLQCITLWADMWMRWQMCYCDKHIWIAVDFYQTEIMRSLRLNWSDEEQRYIEWIKIFKNQLSKGFDCSCISIITFCLYFVVVRDLILSHKYAPKEQLLYQLLRPYCIHVCYACLDIDKMDLSK